MDSFNKSKVHPVSFVRNVLKKYKDSISHGTIRTDKGKELGRSAEFASMIGDVG